MRGRQSACCFTGHRPGKLPWGYDETDLRCLSLKARMADAAEAAYQEGYRHFLCGMALGCDLYFCECVRLGGTGDGRLHRHVRVFLPQLQHRPNL